MTGILLAAVFLTAATSARIAPTKLEDINNPSLPPAFLPSSSTIDPILYTQTQDQLTTEEEVPYTQVDPTPTMEVAPQSAGPQIPTFIPPSSVQEKIVGGEAMSPHEYPSLVGLFSRKRDSLTVQGPGCAATIISDQHVITAAQCVDYWNTEFSIVGGLHSATKPVKGTFQYVTASKTYWHPAHQTFSGDLAVLKLSKRLTMNNYVKTIKLNTKPRCPVTGDKCFTAGWGSQDIGQGGPDKPHKVELEIADQAKCNQSWYGEINNAHVCVASPPSGYKGACRKDYGNPLYCQCDGELKLVGVMSNFRGRCKDPKIPQVFMRVSDSADWIQNVIKYGFGK